jgi:glycosyltransferase involved in cell wall biosynthesis
MGIPGDAFVIGCVAAVKKDHKRIDYLIREFHKWTVDSRQLTVDGRQSVGQNRSDCDDLLSTVYRPPFTGFLLIVGARTNETDELITLAESLSPGRYRILTDCSRSQMPDLYRAMDVFVLTSLFEMMPIAVLEALASGVPCVVNQHPVLEWMVGKGGAGQLSGKKELSGCSVARLSSESPEGSLPSATQQPDNPTTGPASGGMAIDMNREGALAEALAGLTPEWIQLHGRQARERAARMFSKQAVIGQYAEYYREVVGEGVKSEM